MQLSEQKIDFPRPAAGFVFVQKGVVRAKIEFFGDGAGGLAKQAQKLFQVGQDEGEIVLGAGLAPDGFASRARLGEGDDQVLGERRGAPPHPLHFTQVGGFGTVVNVTVESGLEKEFRFRFGEDAMLDGLEGGQLLATRAGAAVGHHGRHVPVQHGRGVTQAQKPPETVFKLLIRR